MKKQLVLEYKSVSDRVDDVAQFVGKYIIKYSTEQEKIKSSTTNTLFNEDDFQIHIKNFLKDGELLTVHYIMYYCQSTEEYDIILGKLGEGANSESDEATNTIKIVSGFIDNNVAYDFYETISHELNHLYHYGMGFEKRNDLYEKTKHLINLGKINIDAYYVGLCSYYSFKHEQDAFAQQFYSYLMQNQPQDKTNEIYKYSIYPTVEKCCNVLKQIKDNDSAIQAMNYLGYSRRDFLKYVTYRKRRMYSKIRNVILRYKEEMNESKRTIESVIRITDGWLNECEHYGYRIEWGRESLFEF